MCVILDKLDKIGGEAVKEQLVAAPLSIPGSSVDKMLQALAAPSVEAILEQLGKSARLQFGVKPRHGGFSCSTCCRDAQAKRPLTR